MQGAKGRRRKERITIAAKHTCIREMAHDEMICQRGLADACFTTEENDASHALPGLGQGILQIFEIALSFEKVTVIQFAFSERPMLVRLRDTTSVTQT